MLRFTRKQRTALSETVRQVANLTVGGLVIGQFVGVRPLSFTLAAVGIALWTMLTLFALVLLVGDEE